MKILHTIENLSKAAGGPSTCTYNLLKGLNDIGLQVDILANNSGNNLATDPFIKYVDYDCVTPLHISKNFKNYLKAHSEEYDIIHANALWTWHSHLAAKTARNLSKPFLITPHGMLYPEGLKSKPWKKQLALALYQRRDIKNADVIQATCKQEMMYLQDLGFKNPIAVVPNCIEIDENISIRSEENDVRTFGFVGRIHPIKNIDRIVDAWIKLGNLTNNCSLEIIGSGVDEYEAVLKEKINNHKVRNIVFRGFLSGRALENAIKNLDFLILASKSENFGMVVPEALINGVPVIVSTGAPWEEVTQFDCGWWIDPTVDNLAESIKNAINISETQRKVMGLNGSNLIKENYAVKKVAQKMADTYDWILNGGDTPSNVYV